MYIKLAFYILIHMVIVYYIMAIIETILKLKLKSPVNVLM